MKKISIYLTAAFTLGIIFFGLKTLSNENTYTSVRKYLLKEAPTTVIEQTGNISWTGETANTGDTVKDTVPPIIEVTNYKNGDVVDADSVDINVQVSDDVTATDKIVTSWSGNHELKKWFNPIVVSARDEAGNVASTYIILERK